MEITTPRLSDVLSYKNENVISRFLDLFNVPEQEAEDIFQETKKFIYLTSIDKEAFICNDMLIIDEMWHNFILFTPDYKAFCEKYFSGFKHHVPASKKEKETYNHELQYHSDKLRKTMSAKIEWLMGLTYDHLGEETVIKWFSTYAEKYNRSFIKQIRK